MKNLIRKILKESEDDFTWAKEITDSATNDIANLKDIAWNVSLPGPEEDFIEAQKWAFGKGFKWGSEPYLLNAKEYHSYSSICCISCVFGDNIRNKTLTYDGDRGDCKYDDKIETAIRIAKENTHSDSLYLFEWDSDKKDAVLYEIVDLTGLRN